MKALFTLLLGLLPKLGICQQIDLVAPLQDSLIETSGLILLDDRLITHNDSGGEAALFELDSISGEISRKVIIDNAPNVDWEDLCYDDTYIYIADFGNNSGNRTNLGVYRVLISDFLSTPNDTVSADTILFDYADQTDFTSSPFATNYDTEAIISWNDSLYIFTKNWGNQWTNVYALPKTPGNYSLPRIDSINVEGFITGASFNATSNSIILSGYVFTYPFIVEISDFTNSQFSSATIERTQVQLPAGYSYQLEGIAPIGTNNYYISTEESITGSSGLFRLKMNASNEIASLDKGSISVYPNPVTDILHIDNSRVESVELFSATGELIKAKSSTQIDISTFPTGVYLLIAKDALGETIGRKRIVIH